MATHACYGLSIRSTIALPELDPVADPGAPADIVITEEAVGDRFPEAVEVLPGLWCHGAKAWLDVPGVARYEVRDGSRVTFEREPGVADGDVKIFLLGTMLGAAMWQRGHLVLHGNAFRVGSSAAVVVGHSGAGKSTLAGELARRGHDVLSDDVVPIDADNRALPGYPRIKLWDHALATFGMADHAYERITASHDKFHVPISRGELGPLAAHFVYVLEVHDRPTLELEEVHGLACFEVLRTHTYRRELAADAVAMRRHLRQCSALAAQARVVRVLRPAATMTAVASADAILADIQSHPISHLQHREAR